MRHFATSLFLFILVMVSPSLARAQQCTGTGACVQPLGCAYWAQDHSGFGQGDSLISVVLYGPSSCIAVPPLGQSAGSALDDPAEILIELAGNTIDYKASAHLFVEMTTTAQNGNDKTLDAEIVQLDIAGGQMPANLKLRESPTLASQGQCQLVDKGGLFQATSFFDVFVELTQDGGQTWRPGSVPEHLVVTDAFQLPAEEETWGRVKATYR